MKLRMAEVPHLIDLQSITELFGIEVGSKIRIGAMATQSDIINDISLASAAPILKEASLQIADPQVRYMGTVGGNVANGDPGNDMPGLMQCLDASFLLRGPDGEREVKARDFYQGAYMTEREDDEVLVAVTFDAPKGGYAYEKQKRKIGDYATAAAAVIISRDGSECKGASIAMTNLSDTPVFCADASNSLVGTSVTADDIKKAVNGMIEAIDPADDNRGPVEFKKHAASVVLTRAIKSAWERA